MVRRSASSPVILFDCQRWATIEFTGIVEEEKSVHVSRNVGRIDGHDRPTPFYSSSLVTVGEGATRPPQLRRLRDVRTRLHSVCGAVGDSDRGKMSTILRFGEAFRVLSVRAVFLCFWYPRSLCSIIICAPRCIWRTSSSCQYIERFVRFSIESRQPCVATPHSDRHGKDVGASRSFPSVTHRSALLASHVVDITRSASVHASAVVVGRTKTCAIHITVLDGDCTEPEQLVTITHSTLAPTIPRTTSSGAAAKSTPRAKTSEESCADRPQDLSNAA